MKQDEEKLKERKDVPEWYTYIHIILKHVRNKIWVCMKINRVKKVWQQKVVGCSILPVRNDIYLFYDALYRGFLYRKSKNYT